MSVRDLFEASQAFATRWDYYQVNVDRFSSRLQALSKGRFEFSDVQDDNGRRITVGLSNYMAVVMTMNKDGWFNVEDRMNDPDYVGLKTGDMAYTDASLLVAAKVVEYLPVRARAGSVLFLTDIYGKRNVTISGEKLRVKF